MMIRKIFLIEVKGEFSYDYDYDYDYGYDDIIYFMIYINSKVIFINRNK